MYWTTGSGRLELELTDDHVSTGYHTGACDDDVAYLRTLPEIKAQLDKWDADTVRRELKEYGAWDEDELADHDDNLDRMLWLACADMHDNNMDEE